MHDECMELGDAGRVIALLLWATSTVITVAVVLTYNEARRKTPGALRLLLRHVVLIGTSHLVALSTLTYITFNRFGKEINYILPLTLYALAASNLALIWVLQFQLARKRGRHKEPISDAV